jgi:hypothetical protein
MSSEVLDPNVLIFVQNSPVFPGASASLRMQRIAGSGFEIVYFQELFGLKSNWDSYRCLMDD